MDTEHEIHSLAAETMALQFVVTQTLFRLSKLGPAYSGAIAQAFDDAANIAESLAIHFGKRASPEQNVKTLRVVEELRAVVFGGETKPKHAI
jgi:hypothetical protein